MCYADTFTETDGTVTAQRYCGWVKNGHTQESANAAAETHQNRPDDGDCDATESATAVTV